MVKAAKTNPMELLTIPERVDAIIKVLLVEQAPISVAAVCRMARVSRANLYATYPDLVTEIRAHRRPKQSHHRAAVSEKADARVSTSEKALLYLCLELQAEVFRLKARLSEKSTRSPNRTVAKR